MVCTDQQAESVINDLAAILLHLLLFLWRGTKCSFFQVFLRPRARYSVLSQMLLIQEESTEELWIDSRTYLNSVYTCNIVVIMIL